jgi:hypothetical protein
MAFSNMGGSAIMNSGDRVWARKTISEPRPFEE